MIIDIAKIRNDVLEAVRDVLERQVEILTSIDEAIEELEKRIPPDQETIAFLRAQALILVGREH